ncbi:MAG TPA: hypothetical protein VGN57_12205 [Pirellulaceae bacterium]|nr:hypothetical protein [Pirellulaceae bacterium]
MGGFLLGRRSFLGLVGALALGGASPLFASPPTEADTSDEARQKAIRAIPFERLTPQSQARLKQALTGAGTYRRAPVEVFPCDPDLYLFLVRNPEVIVNLWRTMNVTQLTCRKVEPYVVDAQDGMGTFARAELLYGDPALHVVLGEGYYEGALLRRRTNGKSVMILSSGYFRGDDGSPYVSVQLDFFLDVEFGAADLLARTFQPMVGKAIDMNFSESAKFLGKVHQVSETNGPGMAELAGKLQDCDPATRQEFAGVVQSIHQRFLERHGVSDALAANVAPGSGTILAPRN